MLLAESERSERSSPIVGAERNRMLAFIFPRRRPIGKLCAAKRSLSTHFYGNKKAPGFTEAPDNHAPLLPRILTTFDASCAFLNVLMSFMH